MDMHQNFVESSGPQSRLYVFNQIFEAERNVNFGRYLELFQKIYEASQQNSFLEFWTTNGDSIVSEEYWREHEGGQKSVDSSETDPIICENSEKADYNSAENNLLWQQYYEKIYVEQYQVFAIIFYEYYKHLHKSLEAKDIESSKCTVNDQNQLINESIVDEFQQLQLLGLPTSFGKNQRNNKTNTKRETKQHNICSGFFSDEEDYSGIMDTIDNPELQVNNQKDLNDIEDAEDKTSIYAIKKKTIEKKKKNRKLRNVPEFLLENKGMLKYWRKRFSLFSRYDDGIRLDCESWFSVTPEKIAIHMADRLACDLIIDAFCGCGGNAIQFARTCKRVVAIDIDPIKISMAKHNATIYGVADKIDFIVGDFLQIGQHGQFQSDVIFLSPPWGGPKYKRKTDYDIENYLQPAGATKLMEIAKTFSDNVVLYLPRNAHIKQVVKLAGEGNRCEVEHNYLDSRLVAITAIYGENILKSKDL
ncbi:trimethylguanosine synthase [Anastrepha obliqua]|uniref:trimethylguanosine synthase n=1 Tax=Anastrepha obliqua TaxID=95512 RepID=UPI00240A2979|nr:trimethylguanosine synthase [Anastrepha obliqua]